MDGHRIDPSKADQDLGGAEAALLHSLIGGRRDIVANALSDRSGEFGEGGGGAQWVWGFGGQFVVAATQVLHEREASDDHLRGAVGAQAAV